jgi:glycine dehydrogenase subunit 1
MARRLHPRRRTILVSRGVHPHYREAITTYVQGLSDVVVKEIALDGAGRTDLQAVRTTSDADTLCLVAGYPNVLGVIEPLDALAAIVHERGGIMISATPEAMALALVRSPGGAGVDVAVAEGQSFGLPMSFGGPGVGLFATRPEHMRAMPGRIVGETIDARGQRGFVLTLAAREQHIRRQRATSNICTNQGLCALAVTVYLATLGRNGLRRVAEENYRRAHVVAERLRSKGVKRTTSAPFFNEFVVHAPAIATNWEATIAREGLVPGFPLGRWLPEYPDALLICVTEAHSEEQIERLIRVLEPAADVGRAQVS